VIEDVSAPREAEARLVSRSPLSHPAFGLAWSNRLASDEVLVRNAIQHGAFHLLLAASLHHGVAFVEDQLATMLQDEDVVMSDRAQAEVRRKLANIRRGIAAAMQEFARASKLP
jgi:hypothetical protein